MVLAPLRQDSCLQQCSTIMFALAQGSGTQLVIPCCRANVGCATGPAPVVTPLVSIALVKGIPSPLFASRLGMLTVWAKTVILVPLALSWFAKAPSQMMILLQGKTESHLSVLRELLRLQALLLKM